MGKAEKKFKRNDFNILNDYLQRDKTIAGWEKRDGKNKEIRARAAERIKTIEHIIEIMEIVERDNLEFKDGAIFRDGVYVRNIFSA